jgi:L-rhamnose isomerase/sugar isomerase
VALELLDHGGGAMPDVRYMIDASHNLKDPIEDLIQSTDQIQVTVAQALLVDRDELRDVQDRNDPAVAAELLHAAFRTDVRPLVAEARMRNRAARDPVMAFRRLGYRAAVLSERGADSVASGL